MCVCARARAGVDAVSEGGIVVGGEFILRTIFYKRRYNSNNCARKLPLLREYKYHSSRNKPVPRLFSVADGYVGFVYGYLL